MNPNPEGQGGDPNGRGAYNNQDPAQRHDRPSSSLSRAEPLQLMTSWAQFQPQGGFRYNLDPLVVPMPGHAGYQYSEASLGPWTTPTNVIGNQNQYQPHPGSAAVFPAPGNSSSVILHAYGAGAYAQQPGFVTVFHAAGYNSNPHALVYGAGAYAQQPGFATVFHAARYNSNPHLFSALPPNNDSYTSAGLLAPPGDANQGASRGPVAGASYRSRPARQNVLASDLRSAVERATTPGEVEDAVVDVMWNQYNDGIPLMEVAQTGHGETALKELVRLAALHVRPDVLRRLVECLIDGWHVGQKNGPDLLRHFFTTLPFHRSIFIHELVGPRFWDMVESNVGYMRILVECLDNAGYTWQGTVLQNTIVTNTVQIASGANGSQLLRTFFQTGRNYLLREDITRSVEANLQALSMDQHGNLVVQACFVPDSRMPAGALPLLRRGLQAFLRLHHEELRWLVQDYRARCVLCRLLRTSLERAVALEDGTELALQILEVGLGIPRPADGDRRAEAIEFLKSSR